MPKFDSSQIGDIEYDFRGFKDSEGKSIDDFGIVPEPSRAQVNRMMKDVNKAFKQLGLNEEKDEDGKPLDTKTLEGVTAAMDKIEDDDTFEKMNNALVKALADTCNGHPSFESLDRLGYRPFMAFFGYLMGEVMSPEASKPDTKPSQNRLRSV